jgi:hypothetical protein
MRGRSHNQPFANVRSEASVSVFECRGAGSWRFEFEMQPDNTAFGLGYDDFEPLAGAKAWRAFGS